MWMRMVILNTPTNLVIIRRHFGTNQSYQKYLLCILLPRGRSFSRIPLKSNMPPGGSCTRQGFICVCSVSISLPHINIMRLTDSPDTIADKLTAGTVNDSLLIVWLNAARRNWKYFNSEWRLNSISCMLCRRFSIYRQGLTFCSVYPPFPGCASRSSDWPALPPSSSACPNAIPIASCFSPSAAVSQLHIYHYL